MPDTVNGTKFVRDLYQLAKDTGGEGLAGCEKHSMPLASEAGFWGIDWGTDCRGLHGSTACQCCGA